MIRRPRKIPAVAVEEVSTWPASKINGTLDRLEKLRSEINEDFIAAGRGHERHSDILKMDDPLAEEYRQVSDGQQILRAEIAHRYGPNAPRRLPRGFGPVRGF